MTPDELYESGRPNIRVMLNSVTVDMPTELLERMTWEELDQLGEIGLWKASRKWQPGGRANFLTYAQAAIRNTILDEIKRIVRADRRNFSRVFGDSFCNQLLEDDGCDDC